MTVMLMTFQSLLKARSTEHRNDASVCGAASWESGAQDGESRIANRSRSEMARRRAADGSPPPLRHLPMLARDERAVCGV